MAERKVLSVFGGSDVGSPAYEVARRLGRLLARAGFTVMSGGYSGVMAVVSQGTLDEQTPSRWCWWAMHGHPS